jgi:hypothetical protein
VCNKVGIQFLFGKVPISPSDCVCDREREKDSDMTSSFVVYCILSVVNFKRIVYGRKYAPRFYL